MKMNEVEQLKARIAELEEQIRVMKVHHNHDMSRMRGKVLKSIKGEIPLLKDSLIALGRTPPKADVAAYIVEGAVEEFTRLEQWLIEGRE